MMGALKSFLNADDGFSTAEIALVLPVTVLFLFGIMHMSLLIFSSNQLHFATETAARCFAVDSATTCTSTGVTQTYAASFYRGTAQATFTASTPACGRQVVGAADYTITLPFFSQTFPLTATSCFPA